MVIIVTENVILLNINMPLVLMIGTGNNELLSDIYSFSEDCKFAPTQTTNKREMSYNGIPCCIR